MFLHMSDVYLRDDITSVFYNAVLRDTYDLLTPCYSCAKTHVRMITFSTFKSFWSCKANQVFPKLIPVKWGQTE